MWWAVGCLVLSTALAGVGVAADPRPDNVTFDAASLQLHNFKKEHPKPIGVLTLSSGAPVDLRDTNALNTDIFTNEYLLDTTLHLDAERVPERTVHAKGGGAWGRFEVTHDVSRYTSAHVFNGIGRKTPVFVRFSTVVQNTGGNDLAREMKGLAAKFYTEEGNLDLVAINFPVYFYKDPALFMPFVHCFRRNPRSFLYDFNSRWDFITKKPDMIHGILWLLSDYGIPDGYRRMDSFPVHTFEISNKHGDRHYVKFNFRTEQGFANLTSEQAMAITDLDYYNRDLYNAIEEGRYPSWRLDMDVMTLDDIKKIDYDPFEVTRLWRRGTYRTVTVGRLTLDKNTDNYFRDVEQSAFSPANLVPGIPGPLDFMFKSRRLSYRDTQNYRLGRNHHKIDVNAPLRAKTYNRDGTPPVDDNGGDAPFYYPNSFSGAVPLVDAGRPREKLVVLETNAVDLENAAEFLREYVRDEAHRQRLADNTVSTLAMVYPAVVRRVERLLGLIDEDLGRRVRAGVAAAAAARQAAAGAGPGPGPGPHERDPPARPRPAPDRPRAAQARGRANVRG